MNRLIGNGSIELVRNVQTRYVEGSVRLLGANASGNGKLGGTADYIRPMCLLHMGFFSANKRCEASRICLCAHQKKKNQYEKEIGYERKIGTDQSGGSAADREQ